MNRRSFFAAITAVLQGLGQLSRPQSSIYVNDVSFLYRLDGPPTLSEMRLGTLPWLKG